MGLTPGPNSGPGQVHGTKNGVVSIDLLPSGLASRALPFGAARNLGWT
jgi:hypothetical protein